MADSFNSMSEESFIHIIMAFGSNHTASEGRDHFNSMGEDPQEAGVTFGPLDEQTYDLYLRAQAREKNIDELRTKLIAHQQLSFPAVCKNRAVRKTDLEQAVGDIHTLIHNFLESDHRYNFFTHDELERLNRYRLAFEIILNRLPPRQRLKGADRDYFLKIIDIDEDLSWVQTKMRGAELSAV